MAITQIVTRLIADLAITAAKLADGAVTLAKPGYYSAKGDLLTRTASVNVVLVAGSDGQILTADSANANGIKWADNAALLAANFVWSEVPSGTINGSNATFTLANTPVSGSVRVYVDGMRMNAGSGKDYTISSGTITFLSGAIPQTGDVILVDYMK